MKEEWLMSGAVVPVDVQTTAALLAEIRRLIDVVGGMALAHLEQKHTGFIDSKINPAPRPWVGLTDGETPMLYFDGQLVPFKETKEFVQCVERQLKKKNT